MRLTRINLKEEELMAWQRSDIPKLAAHVAKTLTAADVICAVPERVRLVRTGQLPQP
jgi:hypothetical protein